MSMFAGLWVGLLGLAAQEEDLKFFEERVRPILVEHCSSCHSPKDKIKGGLRVDSREALLKGGDSGPALLPGRPEQSLLIEVVSWKNPDLRMPPKTRLAADQVAALSEWVRRGAPWPASGPAHADGPTVFDLATRKAQHWSWRPLADPAPPAVRDAAWVRDPLDRFILAKLEENSQRPAAPAGPRDLVRRLSFALAGLPPSPAEVEDYVRDPSDAATAALVDRLLASPAFGETWGRHWLDLVRYAETRGHEFDYAIPNAWAYRDYVIRAFNADLPYMDLLREHVAGDLLPRPRLNPERGFNESVLGTGWWFLGEWIHSPVDPRLDEMDRVSNQIEVFGKAFLGLTVSCARCHDHKFDAISQKDFTALAGFLRSSDYRQVRYDTIEEERRVAEKLAELEPASSAPAAPAPPLEGVDVVADYRKPGAPWAQDGFAFRWAPAGPAWSLDPGNPVLAMRTAPGLAYDPFWDILEIAPGQEGDVGKRKWVDSGRRVRTPEFEIARPKLFSLVSGSGWAFVSVDSHRMVEGPLHGSTIAESKGPGRRWIVHDLRHYVAVGKPVHHAHVEFTPRSPDFTVHLVVQGDAPPPDPFGNAGAPAIPATDGMKDLVRARKALADSLRKESRLAVAIVDGVPSDERLLVRGASGSPREEIPRRFLEALGGSPAPAGSSGRLELAEALTDPVRTPQGPRVIVNRIWHHLFGRGIAPSVDDLGVMGLPPTHPELLDHLASRFVKDGASIKRMIRGIVLSAAYRQSSTPAPGAREADPANLLWHHHPPKRLPAEAVRDAMLAVSGTLDRIPYGPPVAVHLDGFQDGRGKPGQGSLDGAGRRSVYLAVRRNFLSTMLLAFDFPQPMSAIGRRTVSNVPAQALILRNHPFMHAQAAEWAKRLAREGRPPAERIESMFREAYARPPSAEERAAAEAFLADTGGSWEGLAHALFQAKEFLFLR